MSTSFVFMNNDYNCLDQGLLVTSCQKAICEINDEEERLKYFTKNK